MPIEPPIRDQDPQDRFLQCEKVLESRVQALVAEAVSAGWDEGEVCAAIASLADHHILALRYNDQTSASIRKLKP